MLPARHHDDDDDSYNQLIGLVRRVFPNRLGDLGLIHTKDFKNGT